jgi:hypothetical protein
MEVMMFDLKPETPIVISIRHLILGEFGRTDWLLRPSRNVATRLTLLLRSLPPEAATQFAEQECWRQLKAAVTPAYERDLQRVQEWFHQVFMRGGCDNLHEFLRKRMPEIRRMVDDDSAPESLVEYENLVLPEYEEGSNASDETNKHLSDETISDAYHYGFWPTSTSEDKFQAIAAHLGVRPKKLPQIRPQFMVEARTRKKREKARKATWTFPE